MRPASHSARAVVLHQHDAAELAELLEQLEDWLMHAGDDIRSELADFTSHGPAGRGSPTYVRWLIDRLGTHSVALTRQLQACPAAPQVPVAGS